MAFPKAIEINEEGPREGFQIEKKHYPLAARAAVVDALSETGLSKIQVASFVSPKAVPTMADAAELFAAIKKKPGVTYTPLYLNVKGFERARQVSEVDMEGRIHFYTTDQFALQNNNRPAAQVRDDQIAMIDLCVEHGVPLEGAYIMTAFGCNLTGEVPLSAITDLALWTAGQCRVRQMPLPTIVLADTVPTMSNAGSTPCARCCRRRASVCIFTTPAALASPMSMLPWKKASIFSRARWPVLAAVPSPVMAMPWRPAMWRPKRWCSWPSNWALRPASIWTP